MNKLLKGMAAVSVVASMAMAASGTLGVGELTNINDVNVSQAWLDQGALGATDTNISLPLNVDSRYIPHGIPASSLNNPTLNIAFVGLKNEDDKIVIKGNGDLNNSGDTNFGLCLYDINESGENDQNLSVLVFDHVDNTNAKIIFNAIDADRKIANDKQYFLCNIDDNSSTGVSDAIQVLKVDNGSTHTIQYRLYSGDSQEEQDSTQAISFINTQNQLCAKVYSKLDARIDPKADFTAFSLSSSTSGTGCSTSTTTNKDTSDELVVQFFDSRTGLTSGAYAANNYAAVATIKSNHSLPLDATNGVQASTSTTMKSVTLGTPSVNDSKDVFTVTLTNLDNDNSLDDNETNVTITLTTDGETALQETVFTADLGFDLNKDDTVETNYLITDQDAGTWTYKGTKVTIPYLVSNSDTATYVRLTNGLSANATVYWNCTDDSGKTVTNFKVNSADGNSDFVPGNGAAVWSTKDILAGAQDQNPDFAPNGKMKCSPLVTSTSGVEAVVIQTINGSRDRVFNTTTEVQQ